MHRLQVTVWKCPDSGKFFEDREAFIKHRLQIRKIRTRKRIKARADAETKAVRRTIRKLISVEELAEWMVKNQAHLGRDRWDRRKRNRLNSVYIGASVTRVLGAHHGCPPGQRHLPRAKRPTDNTIIKASFNYDGHYVWEFREVMGELGVEITRGYSSSCELQIWEETLPRLCLCEELRNKGVEITTKHRTMSLAKLRQCLEEQRVKEALYA
jgi:hypothetical protein